MFSSRSRFSCSASPFHSPLHSLEGKELVAEHKSCQLLLSLALMVWLCGLHSEDVCAIADAIPNRLFYQVSHSVKNSNRLFSQCPLMGDFFTYVVDAELYLGLIWLISYLWINQHIWYPKVNLYQINHLLQQHTLSNNVSIFISLESSPGHF